MRCFLDKFTQLARILHDRRSWRSRQISTRSWIGLNLMFIGFVRAEKESAVAEGADLTLDLLPLGEKVEVREAREAGKVKAKKGGEKKDEKAERIKKRQRNRRLKKGKTGKKTDLK